MTMKKKSKTGVLLSCAVIVSLISAGCAPGGSEKTPFFPIKELPDELCQTYDPTVTVTEDYKEYKGPERYSADELTKDRLSKNVFNVYYDNTTGCFRGFIDPEVSSVQEEYQKYVSTMSSLRSTFMTGTCNTYILRPDGSEGMDWEIYPEGVFDDFNKRAMYTDSKGGDFTPDTSPMTLWLDKVENASDSSEINVYISDLNEQNGLIEKCGNRIRGILSGNPESDLLILSYTLDYRGKISLPTSMNEGDKDSPVKTRMFDDYVERHYYIVALGDHDTLATMKDDIIAGFANVGVTTFAYQYRDMFYSTSRSETVAVSSIPDQVKQITGENFISENPPLISELTPGAAEEQPPEEDSNSLGASSDSAQPFVPSDSTELLAVKPSGQSYFYREGQSLGMTGPKEISFRLDNSDIYHFETESMKVLTYTLPTAAGLGTTEGLAGGWSEITPSPDNGISAEIEGDTVKVSLTKMLSTTLAGSLGVVVVSVPIDLTYSNRTEWMDVTDVPEGFTDWIESCNVPEIGSADSQERYTNTYLFDCFMDMITQYRSPNFGSTKKLTPAEQIDGAEENPRIITTTEQVGRLNVIIGASE